jgi:hypothetical protein
MILASHGLIASQITQFVGLLDLYPNAAAAYSLRKLRTAYTGSAIRVRRTNLDEMDIGFTSSGELDTAALLAFTGTGALDNGFVTKWYDQSGNARDVTQTTAANQPQIVSSGTVLTTNGKPHILFDGSDDVLFNSVQMPLIDRSVFFVIKEASRKADSGIFGLRPATGNDFNRTDCYEFQGQNTGANRQYGAFGSTLVTYQLQKNGEATIIPQVLINEIKGGSSASLYENNSLITTDNLFTEFNSLSFGGFALSARWLSSAALSNFGNNIFQEYIYWGSDQITNRTLINTNINDFYSIY